MAQPPSSHASATGRLVPAALLAIVVLATVPGCREGGSSGAGAEVPVLDLAGVEVAVAEAIRAAQSAVIADPGSADAWGTLGMVLEAHGFDDAAATCYRQAADLDSSQVSWPYLAAHVLTRVDPAAAIPLFDRAVALDPRSALLRYVYGDALLQLGEEDAAAAEYERALQLDPKARRALLGLGEIALRQGDLDLARQRLDLAANLDFFDREVHAKLARLHRRRGDDEAAAFEALLVRAYPGLAPIADPYHAAVDRKATSVKALTERGLAAVASGRLDEAEQAFWSAMKIRPDSIRNRLNLAGVLARQGRFAILTCTTRGQSC
ncbi:MAG: tetratricopeptide repeat protein [Planctomycetota bacterium]|jgi:tetratricopeptide (TPR) repeat protein